MNKTKIEWADSTWNPVTGCLNGCPYCYAERIANRYKGYQLENELDAYHEPRVVPLPGETTSEGFVELDAPHKHFCGTNGVRNAPYPYRFLPTLHRYRMNDLKDKAARTVFVCSMADLFGKWVPTRWIVEVLDACRAAPQHRYLFLTKNPARYSMLDKLALLPREDNFWYGSTCTDDGMPFFYSDRHNTFVSIEPILKPFDCQIVADELSMINWVILGAETGNRRNKVVPAREWIEPIVDVCKNLSVPLFMKDSMKPIWGEEIITQFPWKE